MQSDQTPCKVRRRLKTDNVEHTQLKAKKNRAEKNNFQ